MKRLWNYFVSEESGQGMVEYGLIIALIAVALIAILIAVSGSLEGVFGRVQTELEGAI